MVSKTIFENWISECLYFYRKLEFFISDPMGNLSDRECIQFIDEITQNKFRTEFTRKFDSEEAQDRLSLEIQLLILDRDRVLLTDQERVYRNTFFYKQFIKDLARVSRCRFLPLFPDEEWIYNEDPDTPHIHVSFDLSGITQHCWLSRPSDFANPDFIDAINRLFEPENLLYRFLPDHDWVIVGLTKKEEDLLCSRGFGFPPPSAFFSVLQYPDTEPKYNKVSTDWNYFVRGKFKYENGDEEGAWEDFSFAMKNDNHRRSEQMYRKITEFINSK